MFRDRIKGIMALSQDMLVHGNDVTCVMQCQQLKNSLQLCSKA